MDDLQDWREGFSGQRRSAWHFDADGSDELGQVRGTHALRLCPLQNVPQRPGGVRNAIPGDGAVTANKVALFSGLRSFAEGRLGKLQSHRREPLTWDAVKEMLPERLTPQTHDADQGTGALIVQL